MVGINYRLGPMGVFSSQEIRDEARARGETGFTNLGLHDQRLAFQWVSVHLGFLTAVGGLTVRLRYRRTSIILEETDLE